MRCQVITVDVLMWIHSPQESIGVIPTDRIKWSATVCLCAGTVVNNLGIYPTGAVIMAVAGLGWLWAAVRMRDRPLIVTNAVLSLLGLGSLLLGLAGWLNG